MEHLKFCIMCLETEKKMFTINPAMLHIYKELVSTYDDLSICLHACYECVHLLHKYGKFKAKCCKAYSILCSLSLVPFEVNKDRLKNIDRKHNKLESVLTACTPRYYYQCYQESSELEEHFYVENVKTESVAIRMQQKYNGNTYESQEELKTLITDPINFDSKLENQTKLNNDEIKGDTKSTLECRALVHNYNTDMLKTLKYNNNTSTDEVSIEDTINGSDLKTAQFTNIGNNTVPVIASKLDSVEYYSIGDQVITNKWSSKVDCTKINSSKKRRHEAVSQNNVHIKKIKKRKSENKASNKNVKLASIRDKMVKKKHLQTNRKSDLKFAGKPYKVSRFSIDSSMFKEHMTVIQLTPEDAKNELLLRKESRNYKMNSHKCELCYRGFISEGTYITHMKKHSLEYGSLKCDICQLSFSESRYLANHRAVCHTRKFVCKICPYVCFGANQARAHIRSHKGKKYTCKDCGEIFRFPNSLSTHTRLRHSIELVCDFCGSTFASPKGLDCHKRLLHREETNEHLGPQCPECDVHFASELAWKRHRVLCSRHDVQDGCGVCGETFSDASGLRAHLREHGPLPATWNMRLRRKPPAATGECTAPQPCSYCNKELRNKKEYKIHMASDHPQVDTLVTPEIFLRTSLMKWVCEVCGKMFKHHSLFTSHQRKHTGEKPYSCPECGKRFKRADAVRAHRPLHTKEYMFKCHLCDKAYGDRGKLNRHVKGHLGIRPYKCPYCDKSFLYQCVVNAHTKYVHCKEPYPKRDRSKKTVKAK